MRERGFTGCVETARQKERSRTPQALYNGPIISFFAKKTKFEVKVDFSFNDRYIKVLSVCNIKNEIVLKG